MEGDMTPRRSRARRLFLAVVGMAFLLAGCDLIPSNKQNPLNPQGSQSDKIFRLFTRLGHQAVAGDGLGLTVVKKIIEKHGGTIWVESEVEAGSTFCFTLPRGGPHSVAVADAAA